MNCPKCGSGNVNITAVTETKSKTRWGCGCLFTWLAFLFPKHVSKTHTEAICQSCGKRWRVTGSQVKKNAANINSSPSISTASVGESFNRSVAEAKSVDDTPFLEREWVFWVSAVVFPPLDVAIVWLKKTDWEKKKKLIVTTILVLWFIMALIMGSGDNSSVDSVSNSDMSATAVSSADTGDLV